MSRLRNPLLVVALGVFVVACGADGGSRSRSLTISAASSLQGPFAMLASDFERAHPDVRVAVNYGSSSTLARQIASGAPADVLAAADTASIRRVRDAGATRGRTPIFARNTMVMVTKPGNPERVRAVSDLARVRVVALCAPDAPCGVYAGRVLDRAGVRLAEDHVTRPADATATIGAVRTGDADAAIVYRTDARGAGITAVPIPAGQNAVARYPIAALREAADPAAARAFVRFVESPAARQVLIRAGFLAP